MLTPSALLRRFGPHIPAPLSSLPFSLGLELARRRRWLQPPVELLNRRFALRIVDLGLCVRFSYTAQGFRPLLGENEELELSAALVDFIALLRGTADADTLFFQRKLGIRGDTELGLIVKNWLDASERPAWLQRHSTQD
jgi:O2-independent ubiquinone biosynthesis accessory factor UbiT